MAEKDIYIPYPAKGLSETYGYSYQEELTSRDERNMRTRDPRTGRFRGAQRAGLSMFKDNDDQANGSEKIRDIAVIPVSANTGDDSSVLSTLALEHAFGTLPADQDCIIRCSTSGLVAFSSRLTFLAYIRTSVFTVDGEFVAQVNTPYTPSTLSTAHIPYCALVDEFGYLVVSAPGEGRLHIYDISGETPDFVNNIFIGADIHSVEAVDGALWVLSVVRDDSSDSNSNTTGQPRSESPSDRSLEYTVKRLTDYATPDNEVIELIAKQRTFWQDASLDDHFDGTMAGAGAERYAPPSAAYWKNPGYKAVGRLSVRRDSDRTLCAVSIGSEEKYAATSIHEVGSATVAISRFGQGKTGFNYRDYSQASFANGNGALYIGVGAANRAILGTGSACELVKEAPSNLEPMYSSMGMTRFDAATTQTLDVTGVPAAGDSLVIKGPRQSDGTICTLTIAFASGTVSGTYPVRITTTSTSMTITVSLGSVNAGVTTNSAWAALIDGAYTMGVWYTRDSTYGNTGNSLFKNCAPNVVISRVPATWPDGDVSDSITITHPDVRTTLTSTSYVQVNGTWSDRTDAAQTQFTNATSTPNLRLHADPGASAPTEAWGYDLGGFTNVQLREQTISSDKTGNTYFNPRGDSYNFGGARAALVVPYNYATTSTAFDFEDASTSINGNNQNIVPSRFGVEFETGVGVSNEIIGSSVCRTIDYDAGFGQASREVYIAVVAGNKLMQHRASGYVDAGNNAVFDTNGYVDSAVGFERAYFTDGIKYHEYDPVNGANGAVKELVASVGQIPQFCQLVAYWRDRLIIAREAVFPGRWHMSKVGDPTNWEFLPAVPTVLDAVSSQTSQAGQVPDAINAVIPFTEDLLLFGGDSTIWALSGDPLAANSYFDLVTDQTGIAFGRAFCKDPEGNLWFFGSDGSLFFMSPGSRPVRVSLNKVEYQLRSIDFSQYRIELAYNSIDEGVHIFQTPKGSGGTIVDHWFYEVPTQSWHKDRFGAAATDKIQPTRAVRANGDQAQDRVMLLGGEDGRVRCLPESPSAVSRSDEQTNTADIAIDSYFTIGPLVNNPYQGAAQMTEFGAVLSPSGDGANFEFFSTDEPENLGAAVARGTLNAGRNDRRLIRVSGDHLFMRIRNASKGECWAWEGGYAKRDYGGDLRR